jgi:hypothetical protein
MYLGGFNKVIVTKTIGAMVQMQLNIFSNALKLNLGLFCNYLPLLHFKCNIKYEQIAFNQQTQ